jgi:hypothetical protein
VKNDLKIQKIILKRKNNPNESSSVKKITLRSRLLHFCRRQLKCFFSHKHEAASTKETFKKDFDVT